MRYLVGCLVLALQISQAMAYDQKNHAFGMEDLAAIQRTADTNEFAFADRYKGKTFAAHLSFYAAKSFGELIGIKFTSEASIWSDEIACIIKNTPRNQFMIAKWDRGQMVTIEGNIDVFRYAQLGKRVLVLDWCKFSYFLPR